MFNIFIKQNIFKRHERVYYSSSAWIEFDEFSSAD